MKGIILAGGKGTRLYPMTAAVSKQLQPVYDKPMIYYPLSILMLAGLTEILLISTPDDIPLFERLLGDGRQWGIELHYATQPNPNGLAEAFIIGEKFLDGSSACLILGDNLFFGYSMSEMLQTSVANIENTGGALIFGYQVVDPTQYGVVQFDSQKRAISIEEKPAVPKSNYAVPGLYFYDDTVVNRAKTIKPSDRGELEITALNDQYLQEGKLQVNILGRGMAWLDTGTPETIMEASNFVQTIEKRQGLKIACLEEIAVHMNLCTKEQVLDGPLPRNSEYYQYLSRVLSSGDADAI